jgi:hypothetical protein
MDGSVVGPQQQVMELSRRCEGIGSHPFRGPKGIRLHLPQQRGVAAREGTLRPDLPLRSEPEAAAMGRFLPVGRQPLVVSFVSDCGRRPGWRPEAAPGPKRP